MTHLSLELYFGNRIFGVLDTLVKDPHMGEAFVTLKFDTSVRTARGLMDEFFLKVSRFLLEYWLLRTLSRDLGLSMFEFSFWAAFLSLS